MANDVFVGNLPVTITRDQLGEFFTQVGQVVDVRLLSIKGKNPNYGFVEMSSEAEAAAAVEHLNGHELGGNNLIVAPANHHQPRRKPQPAASLFVKKLPISTTAEQLGALFAQVGQVVDVELGPQRENKLLYGFVEMSSEAEAAAAIERLNGYELEGEPLVVQQYIPILHKTPKELAREYGRKLNEQSPMAIHQIKLVITHCGKDFARSILEETLAIEAAGGMLVTDQSRRRTPGGVFLQLARTRVNDETRIRVFGEEPYYVRLKKARAATKAASAQPPADSVPAVVLPPLVWDERFQVIQPLLAQLGKASNVKITLVGRPGQIEERQNLVITVLEYALDKMPSLPKGVPTPPKTPTRYVVYIAAKHWQKVAESLADPEDKLIIEGLPVLDPDVAGVSVFATNVTTAKLQAAARKPAPKAEVPANGESGGAVQPKAAAQPKAKKAAPAVKSGPAPTPAPAPEPVTAPTELPLGAIRKLEALRRQEDELRDRLNEIKEQPPEEQIGLGKTLQELKQTQAEIKTLKQRYPRLT